MDLNKAKRIEQLRVGVVMHSWRRISEIICEEFADENQELKGNQLHGVDLCKDAMVVLCGVSTIQEVPSFVRDRWDT
jgi:hypothetical protein